MERSVVLFVAAVAATTLFVVACGGPQRFEVGELRSEARFVEPENAESVGAPTSGSA